MARSTGFGVVPALREALFPGKSMREWTAYRIARNSLYLSAGSGGAMLISVAISLLLARTLRVAEFAAFSAGLAAGTIAMEGVLNLGLRAGVQRRVAVGAAPKNLIRASFLITGLVGLATISVSALFSFALDFSGPAKAAVVLFVVNAVLSAFATIYISVFLGQEQTRIIAGVSLLGKLILLPLVVIMLSFDAGIAGIGVSFIIASVIQLAVLMLAFQHAGGSSRWEGHLGVPSLMRQGLPIGLSALLRTLASRLDLLVLAALANERQVAIYGLATLFRTALILIPDWVSKSSFPTFSRLYESDPTRARATALAVSASVLLLIMSVAGALLIGLAGLITDAFGKNFQDADRVIVIVVLATAFTSQQGILRSALYAARREKADLVFVIISLGLTLSLQAILVPSRGAEGTALAVLFSAIAVTGAYVFAVLRSVAPAPRYRETWQES